MSSNKVTTNLRQMEDKRQQSNHPEALCVGLLSTRVALPSLVVGLPSLVAPEFPATFRCRMLHGVPNRLTYEALPQTPHDASNKRAPKRTKNAPDELIAGALRLVVILVLGEEGLHLLGACLLFVGELFGVSFDDLLNVALKPRLANITDLLVGKRERPLCIADLVRLDEVV